VDRLDAMRVFVAVAEAGSLSAAARRMRAPLTSVSRKLGALEDELGVRLVMRTTRKLALTDVGRGYLDSCRRVLGEVEDGERLAAGAQAEPRGVLSITAPIVFGRLHVLPVIAELLAAYPALDVRLSMSDRVVDLVEDGLDAAVRIGVLADSSAVAIKLGEVRYVVCASPAYLRARGTPETPDDVAPHACIMFAPWSFRGRRIAIHARLAVDTAEAALDAALAGLGLTRVLSYQAAEHVRAGRLKIVLAEHEDPPLPVHVVHADARLVPARLRAFVDFAVPRLRARLRSIRDIAGSSRSTRSR